jgi:hypothetical protein
MGEGTELLELVFEQGCEGVRVLRFAKRCPTWMLIVWMQLLMTQL